MEASPAQLPAILVIAGGAIVATGLLPRWAGALSWTIVTVSILLGPLFGPTVALPQWAQYVSPFTHVPKVPGRGARRPPPRADRGRGRAPRWRACRPSAGEVEGDRCYHDLSSIPGGVDAVVIATRADRGHKVMRAIFTLTGNVARKV